MKRKTKWLFWYDGYPTPSHPLIHWLMASSFGDLCKQLKAMDYSPPAEDCYEDTGHGA